MSSAKWRLFRLGLNVLNSDGLDNGMTTNRYHIIILTHCGLVTSYNGLSPVWCQAITETNVDFHSIKLIWKYCLQNGSNFVQALIS